MSFRTDEWQNVLNYLEFNIYSTKHIAKSKYVSSISPLNDGVVTTLFEAKPTTLHFAVISAYSYDLVEHNLYEDRTVSHREYEEIKCSQFCNFSIVFFFILLPYLFTNVSFQSTIKAYKCNIEV